MNSIGGDGFWLISPPGSPPVGIDGCGAAAATATINMYRSAGFSSMPHRGGLAANTVAGTVSSWQLALQTAGQYAVTRLPLARLLGPAIDHAHAGINVTRGQQLTIAARLDDLIDQPGFASTFLRDGRVPSDGVLLKQTALGDTLNRLAEAGLDDFYKGDVARSVTADLQRARSPLQLADLHNQRATHMTPLSLKHTSGTIYNLPAPTQGLASLIILGVVDRLLPAPIDPLGAELVHISIEATKLAFEIRDRVITDPAYSAVDYDKLLGSEALDALADQIDPKVAAPWSAGGPPSDTVWLGVIDADGMAVSFIQSTYHEFGSGVVLPVTGILWQNRGSSFSLDASAPNPLMPGRKPFHTLNPAAAELDDGKRMVFGSMGGDGQPQFINAVFQRVQRAGLSAQDSVAAPRWLLGRTWGEASDTVKLENRFPEDTVAELISRGHDVEMVESYDERLGHAGALIRDRNGQVNGGSDPRSDGSVATI
jgi:gamma-glutamyltranspeptidase/glutathione hydrolase